MFAGAILPKVNGLQEAEYAIGDGVVVDENGLTRPHGVCHVEIALSQRQ